MRRFFDFFGISILANKAERDTVFNSFVYGQGLDLIWSPTSEIAQDLTTNIIISTNLDNIEFEIRKHLDEFGWLNGLASSLKLITQTKNPNFPKKSFTEKWALAMFGGTQKREIRVTKCERINAHPTLPIMTNECYEIEFIYSFTDCFGLGMYENFIWGVEEQWVLQHYRNNYCCNGKAFMPIINHTVEFRKTFNHCIE